MQNMKEAAAEFLVGKRFGRATAIVGPPGLDAAPQDADGTLQGLGSGGSPAW